LIDKLVEYLQVDISLGLPGRKSPCTSKLQPTRCNFFHLFIFTEALHVSGGFSAHHQEHV